MVGILTRIARVGWVTCRGTESQAERSPGATRALPGRVHGVITFPCAMRATTFTPLRLRKLGT